MSLTLAITVGIAMGIVFGFALEKSRVFEPGIIVGQMQMKNFIMLKVFLTAVGTGAVVLAVLNGFGYVKLAPKAALYSADIIGGLMLGAGYRDALFTLVGGLCGAVAFTYAQPVLSKTFLAQGGGKIIFADLVGVPYWMGALVLAMALVVVLVVLEAWRPWRTEMGKDVDGNLESTGERPRTTVRVQPAE